MTTSTGDPSPAGSSGYRCPACGTWVYGGCLHTCGIPAWPSPGGQQGWSCPHCNKAHPPWVTTCPEPQQMYSITTTGLADNG